MDVDRLWRARMAGFLYPSDPAALRAELARCAGTPALSASAAIGLMVPHSSLAWCGTVTGAVMAQVRLPRRCVVLGPNHTGAGAGWSVLGRGAMQTPLGELAIDTDLAQTLQGLCPLLEGDEVAHVGEHAVEAVLPWLRWRGGADVQCVPIISRSDSFEETLRVADALVKAIRQTEEPVTVIASADWSQFRPAEAVRATDARLLASLRALDARVFLDEVASSGASMCGATVMACVLEAARQLGATTAQPVRYVTSADAGGDPHSAIGFAGVILR